MMELIKVSFRGDSQASLKRFLKHNIESLRDGLRELHETHLPKWRRRYEAKPMEEVRHFPFENASNLVVPIVAIHSDTLLARIMAGIFKIRPTWPIRVFGKFDKSHEPAREALEDFMYMMAIEPSQWDLYRVYREYYSEVIKYGTSTLKIPWLTQTIDRIVPPGDGSGKYDFIKETLYDGSRPEKIPFEDFWVPPAAKTVEQAHIKVHRRRMLRYELEERRFKQIYEPSAVDKILKSPDRTSPYIVQQMREGDTGVKSRGGDTDQGYEEWDIYECWFNYRFGNTNTPIIATYHHATETLLRVVYNTFPDETFVTARLFYQDDQFYGVGFAQILGMFQEEISQQHNQRRDAMTVANSCVWRVSADSKLHSGYKIYPSAMLPAEKDEVEPMKMGEPGQLSIDEEQLSLQLAERRSGVTPPQQGAGAGNFKSNRGGVTYSAVGTLSLLQEGNSRTDLNVSDARYAHTKIGRVLARQMAEFGMETQVLDQLGEMADNVREALRMVKAGTLGLMVTPATASLNREVEKQNDIMLTSIMARHYQMVTGLLTAVANPGVPPAVADYMRKTIESADNLMEGVLRHFGYDEPERYVPEPQLEQGQQNGGNPQAPGASQQVPQMAGGPGVPGLPGMVPGGQGLLQ